MKELPLAIYHFTKLKSIYPCTGCSAGLWDPSSLWGSLQPSGWSIKNAVINIRFVGLPLCQWPKVCCGPAILFNLNYSYKAKYIYKYISSMFIRKINFHKIYITEVICFLSKNKLDHLISSWDSEFPYITN